MVRPALARGVAAPAVLDRLPPDKLVPGADAVPDRFETGTPAFELLAGVIAAVDHLAGLDDVGDRHAGGAAARLDGGGRAVRGVGVLAGSTTGLRSLLHVYVLGSPTDRAPTVRSRWRAAKPREVTEELARRGICAWDGDYYAYELMDALGVGELGGAVRVGLRALQHRARGATACWTRCAELR